MGLDWEVLPCYWLGDGCEKRKQKDTDLRREGVCLKSTNRTNETEDRHRFGMQSPPPQKKNRGGTEREAKHIKQAMRYLPCSPKVALSLTESHLQEFPWSTCGTWFSPEPRTRHAIHVQSDLTWLWCWHSRDVKVWIFLGVDANHSFQPPFCSTLVVL